MASHLPPPSPLNHEPINGTNDTINDTNGRINAPNEPINGTNDPINGTNEPINGTDEPINGQNEPINGQNEPINGQNEPINGTNEPINGQNEPINGTIKSLKEVENIVLTVIKKYPGISRKKIVPLTDASEPTVRRALKTLGKMGLIEYKGSNKTGGYYSL